MSAFTWFVEELPSGARVASGSAPTLEEAKREAGHYAIQYAQDGPVIYKIKQGRKTILTISMLLVAKQ